MNTHDLFFLTATIVDWRPLLFSADRKDIILKSLKFLSENKRCDLYSFVIMPNHIHLIWRIKEGYNRPDVQRDFLRFTSQQILKDIRNTDLELYDSLITNRSDRKRQL